MSHLLESALDLSPNKGDSLAEDSFQNKSGKLQEPHPTSLWYIVSVCFLLYLWESFQPNNNT